MAVKRKLYQLSNFLLRKRKYFRLKAQTLSTLLKARLERRARSYTRSAHLKRRPSVLYKRAEPRLPFLTTVRSSLARLGSRLTCYLKGSLIASFGCLRRASRFLLTPRLDALLSSWSKLHYSAEWLPPHVAPEKLTCADLFLLWQWRRKLNAIVEWHLNVDFISLDQPKFAWYEVWKRWAYRRARRRELRVLYLVALRVEALKGRPRRLWRTLQVLARWPHLRAELRTKGFVWPGFSPLRAWWPSWPIKQINRVDLWYDYFGFRLRKLRFRWAVFTSLVPLWFARVCWYLFGFIGWFLWNLILLVWAPLACLYVCSYRSLCFLGRVQRRLVRRALRYRYHHRDAYLVRLGYFVGRLCYCAGRTLRAARRWLYTYALRRLLRLKKWPLRQS